ncbi:GNAT family N-acetyltransferase [Sphingomonas sp. SRS2]|uniref:GNAT family N-acetyltransferase n=1 Tax=Sphingomonas sp. SRS2 TaxID=133190 RepID=UPI0006184313|nr:GNAT family N-acetyltransferase [Sphingomonas sp. SRS2]KKC26062.1 GCN5 family acetyltransferase [Sphingomonas sp. SRS2]
MSNYLWRNMRADDLAGVVSVAAVSFPSHFEGHNCFQERFAVFPQGCFSLTSADALRGYLIAYPWPLGSIPPLNSLLGILSEPGDALYLHDLALHPDVRGQGYTRSIVERVAREMSQLGARRIALVSVNDTVGFWQGMGFGSVTGDDAITQKLESYGDRSSYMIREL